ncbi:MAG TPA: hypothetical protein VFD92_17805 [Candidatus Binatia bacterium]|nr:hypothetical protein [Candidatus Binatia bacterium]
MRRPPIAILAALLLASTLAWVRPAAAAEEGERLLDVDLDDRVDPVRPGQEIVYEVSLQNESDLAAPDVVVVDALPPGTTYVVAYRPPDYGVEPAEVGDGTVTWRVGTLEPCGHGDHPPCGSLWAVLRVDDDVAPGTVLRNHAAIWSSDTVNFEPYEGQTFTSVGSFAIRSAKIAFSRANESAHRATVIGDVARSGLHTPSDPATPDIDLTSGIRVVLGGAGDPPFLDVFVPPDGLRCRGGQIVRCRLADRRLFQPLGLDSLDITLRSKLQRRNNASVRVRTARLAIPRDAGPDLTIVLEAAGERYDDVATMVPTRSGFSYTHNQSAGPP